MRGFQPVGAILRPFFCYNENLTFILILMAVLMRYGFMDRSNGIQSQEIRNSRNRRNLSLESSPEKPIKTLE